MMLARRAPCGSLDADLELWTFECPSCDAQLTRTTEPIPQGQARAVMQ